MKLKAKPVTTRAERENPPLFQAKGATPMTLRDHLAAHAPITRAEIAEHYYGRAGNYHDKRQEAQRDGDPDFDSDEFLQHWSRARYRYADAMLSARLAPIENLDPA